MRLVVFGACDPTGLLPARHALDACHRLTAVTGTARPSRSGHPAWARARVRVRRGGEFVLGGTEGHPRNMTASHLPGIRQCGRHHKAWIYR